MQNRRSEEFIFTSSNLIHPWHDEPDTKMYPKTEKVVNSWHLRKENGGPNVPNLDS